MNRQLIAFLILSLSGQIAPAFAAPQAIKQGDRLRLAVPPIWDGETRTYSKPGMLNVWKGDNSELCSFYGGVVTIQKVDGDQVYFQVDSKKKPLPPCSQLVTSIDFIRSWNPAFVKEQEMAFSKESASFKTQLAADVQKILDKQEQQCVHAGNELEANKVYKIEGNVFLYGPNTTAFDLKGAPHCHVENGSIVDSIGLDQTTNDFALVVYHSPKIGTNKPNPAPLEKKNEPVNVCKDKEQVVLSIKKIKNNFKFSEASLTEILETKGIAATLNSRNPLRANAICDAVKINVQADTINSPTPQKRSPVTDHGHTSDSTREPDNDPAFDAR